MVELQAWDKNRARKPPDLSGRRAQNVEVISKLLGDLQLIG